MATQLDIILFSLNLWLLYFLQQRRRLYGHHHLEVLRIFEFSCELENRK